jgi:hypothetical protein
VIDLQEVQDISSISANFFTRFSLLDFDASICAVYTSVDNINYKIVDSPILHSVDPKEDTTRILPHNQSKVSKVRYVKCLLKIRKITGTQGYGGDAFILLTKLQLNKSGIIVLSLF